MLYSHTASTKVIPLHTLDHFPQSEDGFSYLDHITEPDTLVAMLDDSSNLEAEHIGFTGIKSTSYPVYKRLSRIASDSTLLQLTRHPNPKIRVYAFWSLATVNYPMALDWMKSLRNDRATVMYRSGCSIIPETVAQLAEICLSADASAEKQ